MDKDIPSPLLHGAAGILSGALSEGIFYPLGFLRTRMHTYTGGSKYPLRSAREIIQQEGLKGMYRGLPISVVLHGVGWGMYLTSFKMAQQSIFVSAPNEISLRHGNDNKKEYSVKNDFLSAYFAATVTGTIITPLNLVKTRQQLHDLPKSPNPRGFCKSIYRIVEKEGPWTLLRGIGPQILLTGNTIVQVTLYEGIKRNCFSDTKNPTVTEVIFASAFAKSLASLMWNPLEVVRTRMQDKKNNKLPEYRSMGVALRTIWRTEGLRGLFRGLPVNMCRVVPSTVTSFVLYEKFLVLFTWLSCQPKAFLYRDVQHAAPELM